jgi:hypothetical protein
MSIPAICFLLIYFSGQASSKEYAEWLDKNDRNVEALAIVFFLICL